MLSTLLAKYNAALAARPLATNAATGAVTAAIGDVGCQLWFEERDALDSRRTLDMAFIRAAVMAPFLSVYFPFLNRLVPGTTMPRVLGRVLADQCIGSPVSIALLFTTSGLLQGRPGDILPRLKEQLWPTMKNGASYWPFVHSLNFRFVPLAHQPLVAHTASLWWNGVLSYRANLTLAGKEGEEAGEGKKTGEAGSEAAATGASDAAVATTARQQAQH